MHDSLSLGSLSALAHLVTLVSAGFSAGAAGSESLGDASQLERGRDLHGLEFDVDLNTLLIANLGIAITDSVLPLFSLDVELAQGGSGPLDNVAAGAAYALTVNIDGSDYQVLFDTGSSDLFLAKHNFVCEDADGAPVEQYQCPLRAGPEAFSQGTIEDQLFNISYGDGSFATGDFGYGTVSYGGITVSRQQYALVNTAYWPHGNNFTSGIIGFAFPNNTAAYYTNPTRNDHGNVPYNPWLFSAIDDGDIVPAQFTVGLYRRGKNDTNGSPGGFLALGGAPQPASLPYTGVWASSPIVPNTNADLGRLGDYLYYSFHPDGFTVNGEYIEWKPPTQKNIGPVPSVVDSGTPVSQLPLDVIEAIIRTFDPVPFPNPFANFWYFPPCNATPPEISFRIGGKDFAINPRDVLLDDALGENPDDGSCLLGFQPLFTSPDDPHPPTPIFGANFIRNAVVVHDLENLQLIFGGVDWN
ncbi:unnamed protein product [Zymoseptoria tritici ST99CH_1A5]|uniref:Peptidase A1 domain-containing protein n=3 Tax=Zymoseptoria tritici TaxID=1047171 RepID=A0A1X7RL33_ZYMT9|nr:unnamed protein product [Zymoseptoria tritici ST99CH_3D7]SMR46679.1 unnamed protein product [Zymoseptoria tritici ST99CH_1E4]SMR47921.1 unnamed protein product [Zymoseptoria tritici ST99CH_3D1]SMY21827.1 unnamed protein product [Zymoseptoria tritici ST99CH_1A5]